MGLTGKDSADGRTWKPLLIVGALALGDSVNLGDIAQAKAGRRALGEEGAFQSPGVVANSVAERSVDEHSIWFVPAELLLGPPSMGKLRRALRFGWGSARLLRACKRFAKGADPRGVGQGRRHRYRRLAAELREYDCLYWSGSGALTDTGSPFPVVMWLVLTRSMALLGRPVVLSGQQVGPVRFPWSRWFFRWGLKDVPFVGVRSPLDQRTALRLGLRPERVKLVGDDAWRSVPAPADVVESVLEPLGVHEGYVAVQARVDDSTGWTIQDVADLARQLDDLATGLDAAILLIPMMTGERSPDFVTLTAMRGALASPCAVAPASGGEDIIKGLIARASIAVGTSNHFCVFAASSGVPVVGLWKTPYLGQKLVGLAELVPELVTAHKWEPGISVRILSDTVRHMALNRSGSNLTPTWQTDTAARFLREYLAERSAPT